MRSCGSAVRSGGCAIRSCGSAVWSGGFAITSGGRAVIQVQIVPCLLRVLKFEHCNFGDIRHRYMAASEIQRVLCVGLSFFGFSRWLSW